MNITNGQNNRVFLLSKMREMPGVAIPWGLKGKLGGFDPSRLNFLRGC